MICSQLAEVHRELVREVASNYVDGDNYLKTRDKQVRIREIENLIDFPNNIVKKLKHRTARKDNQEGD